MKRILSVLILLSLVLALTPLPTQAKILQQCHYCYGTGKYTCDNPDCGGKGYFTCPRCKGIGTEKEKCANCNGTGKCGHCNGTKFRLGEPDIPCDACQGTGKCQGGPGVGPCTNGYYTHTCPDCKGTGTVECKQQWCVYARNHNGNCPQCKGTGYEGDGVEGTPNDGYSNTPKPGDGIYRLDGSYYIYGGGSANTTKKESGNNNNQNNQQNHNAQQNNPDPNPTPEPEQEEPTETTTTTIATRVSRSPSGKYGKTDIHYEPVGLPKDRYISMFLGTKHLEDEDFAGTTATAIIRYDALSNAHKDVYDSLEDADLAQILGNVQGILSTARIGNTSYDNQNAVNSFLQANHLTSLEQGNILVASFQGHIDIGFSIQVSIEVDHNYFGGKPVHVFHVAKDGTISRIKDKDVSYITNEKGEATRVEFFTDSFSDFLITDTPELLLPSEAATKTTLANEPEEDNADSFKHILFISGGVAIIAILCLFLFQKKKKPEQELENSKETNIEEINVEETTPDTKE